MTVELQPVTAPNARETFERWIDRGDAVGVFVNMDLGHQNRGHCLYTPLDTEEQTRLPIGKAHAPDGRHGLGWRYILQHVVRDLSLFSFQPEEA